LGAYSAVLVALVALGSLTWPTVGVGAQLNRPNIILILSDDQTLESVQKMPYLRSRIAPQGGWYRFDNAFINNATCCPSRATIMTGLWSHHHGIEATGGARAYDDSDTIATRLHAAGYRTGFVGKYHLTSTVTKNAGPTYVPPGWDDWHGFANNTPGWYYKYTLNENGTLVGYGSTLVDYSTDVLRDKALHFINSHSSEPFFLIYAPRAPHNNWTAAPRHVGRYKGVPVEHSPNFNEEDMSDKPTWWNSQAPRNVNNIDAARRKEWDTTLALDDAVKAIHERVRNLGLMSRTVIFFMTDNGYAFGEHRYNGKACAYEECSRTPLLVKYGGGTQGWTFPQLIGNEDLAPTFADLAGVSQPDPTDGQSYATMLQHRTTPASWENEILLHGYDGGDNDGDQQGHPPTFWGLRTPGYKYIETVDTGEVELYDLTADPYELQNVAERAEYASTRAQLAERLWELARRGTSAVGNAWIDAAQNLNFDAGPGAKNDLTVTASGGFWVLTDTVAPIAAGAGCEQVGVNRVRCPRAGVSGLALSGDDKNDTIITPDGVDATVEGEAGDDALTTNSGSDSLRGGDGRDMLDGGAGADILDGGDGLDTVSYAGRAADQSVEVDLDGAVGDDGGAEDGPAGARDWTRASVENVIGGDGADLITGSATSNTLIGGGGADQLRGLAGNDTIRANADGSTDDVNCGAGTSDVVFADAIDIVRTTGPDACELVKSTAPRQGPLSSAAPASTRWPRTLWTRPWTARTSPDGDAAQSLAGSDSFPR
jgi:arylsulfatase A-like enzyme